jgi:hypothetical protein
VAINGEAAGFKAGAAAGAGTTAGEGVAGRCAGAGFSTEATPGFSTGAEPDASTDTSEFFCRAAVSTGAGAAGVAASVGVAEEESTAGAPTAGGASATDGRNMGRSAHGMNKSPFNAISGAKAFQGSGITAPS